MAINVNSHMFLVIHAILIILIRTRKNQRKKRTEMNPKMFQIISHGELYGQVLNDNKLPHIPRLLFSKIITQATNTTMNISVKVKMVCEICKYNIMDQPL